MATGKIEIVEAGVRDGLPNDPAQALVALPPASQSDYLGRTIFFDRLVMRVIKF